MVVNFLIIPLRKGRSILRVRITNGTTKRSVILLSAIEKNHTSFGVLSTKRTLFERGVRTHTRYQGRVHFFSVHMWMLHETKCHDLEPNSLRFLTASIKRRRLSGVYDKNRCTSPTLREKKNLNDHCKREHCSFFDGIARRIFTFRVVRKLIFMNPRWKERQKRMTMRAATQTNPGWCLVTWLTAGRDWNWADKSLSHHVSNTYLK